jgi:enoyl-CoA hydratase/carnithine racemase
MHDFETLQYEAADGVAWVTLNRPDALNSFNRQMQAELHEVWTGLRHDDDVRCVVLTGAGDKAFCTGIDRAETLGDGFPRDKPASEGVGFGDDPWHFEDPGDNIGPKTCGLWKPVIAAVNGMACGGAFYMLGEVEFIIAAEHATFFDPHVTYGMTAVFEPIHMLQKMPFHEIMRLSLLGNHERMSAKRAHDVGLVSEVVPSDGLHDAAAWAASRIASQPGLVTAGTVRALWAGRELSRQQALDMARFIVRLGTDRDTIMAGQEAFASGKRVEWRLR